MTVVMEIDFFLLGVVQTENISRFSSDITEPPVQVEPPMNTTDTKRYPS